MIMSSPRRPSQQILLNSEEEQIFDLEQMSVPEEESLAPLSGREWRRYRKANKHRGDYCLLDLGNGESHQKKRSSSFSSGMGDQVRSWKSITFNKK